MNRLQVELDIEGIERMCDHATSGNVAHVIGTIKSYCRMMKEETSIGLSEHENGVEQGRMEIINALSIFLDSLQEEPVCEDLEEEISRCILDEDMNFDSCARHFANWQKEQFEKNRLAACDKQTDEEAEIERDFVTSIIEKEHRQPTFDDAIKYGVRLQKEQMMAKAIDGEVTFGKGLVIPSLGFVLNKEGLDLGDKLKLIIIKED